MSAQEISVARQFSEVPAGRYHSDGPFSGEDFRRNLLEPALKAGATIIVYLDDVEGYGSSFLEEAFGGLVRLRIATADQLRRKLLLRSEDDSLIAEIWSYIETALPEN